MMRVPFIREQTGVALPITLVLLVIITVTVMSSLDSSRAQERTAQRLQDKESAFQAAETALRAGERWLETHRSVPRGHGELPAAAATYWDGRVPAATGEITSAADSAEGAFHVAPSSAPGIFIITARASVPGKQAVAVLRSHYHLGASATAVSAGRLSWQQLR